MKHIPKTAEPTAFTQWKIGEDPNWNPGWGELDSSRTMKTLVKKALLDEQGNICCYCGIGLTDTDSHIEHFRPRHGVYAFPQGEIEYANLLACCLPEKQDAAKNHCGMKKGAADPGQIVSPLDPTCEARFSYASNGEIEAHTKTDAIALNTISKLGLDIAFLTKHRYEALEGAGLFDAAVTSAELTVMATQLLQRNPDNTFTPFCFSTAYVLRNYV